MLVLCFSFCYVNFLVHWWKRDVQNFWDTLLADIGRFKFSAWLSSCCILYFFKIKLERKVAILIYNITSIIVYLQIYDGFITVETDLIDFELEANMTTIKLTGELKDFFGTNTYQTHWWVEGFFERFRTKQNFVLC